MSPELITVVGTAICAVGAVLFFRRAVQGQREYHAQAGQPVDATPAIRYVGRMSSFATLFATFAVLLPLRAFDKWYVAVGAFVVLRVAVGVAVTLLGKPRPPG